MRRIILLGALAMILVAVIAFPKKTNTLSLSRIADRAERADVLPEDTRVELKRLIEMVNRDGVSDRNVTRIERAMQIKPTERPALR